MKIVPTYIEPRASKVDLGYPEGEPARLALQIPMGKVELKPGGGESIVSGQVVYNVEECKPSYSVKGRTVRIRQRCHFLIPLPGKLRNLWQLDLGTAQPYSLDVGVGAAAAEVDLSGVPLTGLKLDSGVGELDVAFNAINPAQMRHLDINTGAGQSTITGLLNANAEQMSIDTGVGQLIVHVTGGPITTNGRLSIEGGVGEIVLVVDEDAPIRVTISTGLGSASVDDALIRTEKGYETPAYAEAGARLDIAVSSGVGAVRVEVA